MSLHDAVSKLKKAIPRNEESAQSLLNTLTRLEREQLIAAVYLGREHLHSTHLRSDVEISRSYTDHISEDEYARILSDKGENAVTYLEKLIACAKASGFDLDSL